MLSKIQKYNNNEKNNKFLNNQNLQQNKKFKMHQKINKLIKTYIYIHY